MAPNNRLTHAVDRVDPDVEVALLPKADGAALLVAGGGCTALNLAARRPYAKITLVDDNPAQLAHVEKKRAALVEHAPGSRGRIRAFGTNRDDPESLSANGTTESLWRAWRAFVDDLVMTAADRRAILIGAPERMRLSGEGAPPLEELVDHALWPIAFDAFFGAPVWRALFKVDAADAFAVRSGVERALKRDGAARRGNPFLAHELLGHYLDDGLPHHLTHAFSATTAFTYVEKLPSLAAFDLVSLPPSLLSAPALADVKPGTVVVVRGAMADAVRFGDAFVVDEAKGAELVARDRSMFTDRIVVATRK